MICHLYKQNMTTKSTAKNRNYDIAIPIHSTEKNLSDSQNHVTGKNISLVNQIEVVVYLCVIHSVRRPFEEDGLGPGRVASFCAGDGDLTA